jgi:hypothetical protein
MTIETMPLDLFESYYSAIEVFESQEILASFTIADWPNLKSSRRQGIHRRLHKIAYPENRARTISVEDLKKMFESGNI